MWCIPPPNSSSSFELCAILWDGNFDDIRLCTKDGSRQSILYEFYQYLCTGGQCHEPTSHEQSFYLHFCLVNIHKTETINNDINWLLHSSTKYTEAIETELRL